MRIRWTPVAAADLQHINDYLKEDHPRHRLPTIRKIYKTLRFLKQWPQRGRIGREEGTRELLFVPVPYVAVYRIREQTIENCAGLPRRTRPLTQFTPVRVIGSARG